VAYLKEKPTFILDKNEVEELIVIPYQKLIISDELINKKMMKTSYLETEVPYFAWEEYVIWGATAMILSELRVICKELC
jgi:hypothetical protein